MTASNLGIIFGPTLIKPRQADAEVSLSSLVDYPYQALIVELLIRHYEMVFDTPLSPLTGNSPTEVDTQPRHHTQLSRHSKSLGDIKEVILEFMRKMRWLVILLNMKVIHGVSVHLLSHHSRPLRCLRDIPPLFLLLT